MYMYIHTYICVCDTSGGRQTAAVWADRSAALESAEERQSLLDKIAALKGPQEREGSA